MYCNLPLPFIYREPRMYTVALLLCLVAVCDGFLYPVTHAPKPHVCVRPLLATTILDPGHKAVLDQQNFIEHTGRHKRTLGRIREARR